VKTSTGFFLSSPEYPREFYPATFTPDLSRPPHPLKQPSKSVSNQPHAESGLFKNRLRFCLLPPSRQLPEPSFGMVLETPGNPFAGWMFSSSATLLPFLVNDN
jgi:hypothetical protein